MRKNIVIKAVAKNTSNRDLSPFTNLQPLELTEELPMPLG